jgi:glycosyltransferase involved in cell wall biosynthesis
MKVSVIIPTLNEEGCIGDVLRELPKDEVDEVIIIDGNSQDGTVNEVKEAGYKAIPQVGKGYGSAFMQGVEESTGDIIIMMDADGSHNPADIPKLVEIVKNNENTIALGSRYTKGSGTKDDTFVRSLGNKFFTWFANFKQKLNVTDALYLYAAFPKEAFNKIETKTEDFAYCVEVIIKAKKADYNFIEVPSFERKRYSGESKVSAVRHGWTIFKAIYKG